MQIDAVVIEKEILSVEIQYVVSCETCYNNRKVKRKRIYKFIIHSLRDNLHVSFLQLNRVSFANIHNNIAETKSEVMLFYV